MNFFITFGSSMYGGLYTRCYALVSGDDERAVRARLQADIDGYYSFIYPVADLYRQKSLFNLTECPYEHVVDLYEWAHDMRRRWPE